MISESEVEKAAEYLRDQAKLYAQAKSERDYLSEFRKSKKALLINECTEGTGQVRESFAYAHPDYINLLEALRIAEEEEITILWRMKAAQERIEIWKCQQYVNKRVDRGHQ